MIVRGMAMCMVAMIMIVTMVAMIVVVTVLAVMGMTACTVGWLLAADGEDDGGHYGDCKRQESFSSHKKFLSLILF